jgi:hypothetical protein
MAPIGPAPPAAEESEMLRHASIAIATAALIAQFAVAPGRAADAAPRQPGYHFDAEHVHGGVRWGYADLYRAPVMATAFAGCRWMGLPTPFGLRFRPDCKPVRG